MLCIHVFIYGGVDGERIYMYLYVYGIILYVHIFIYSGMDGENRNGRELRVWIGGFVDKRERFMSGCLIVYWIIQQSMLLRD